MRAQLAGISIEGLEGVLERIAERLEVIETMLDSPREAAFYTVKDASGYLGLTEQSLRRARRRGLIESTKSGSGRLLFTKAQLDNFANGQ